MILLLNVVFGLLAGWVTLYLMGRAGAPQPVAVVVAVLVGIIIFLANLASQVV